jgi:hypothetical protein
MIEITEQTTTQTAEGKTRITVTIEVPAREHIGAPLDLERGLQRALNGIGQAVMTEALGRYDTEGEPIRFGPFAMSSKGRSRESYKTLFGPVEIERHTYQTSDGGRTFCPLEQSARICENATIGLCAMLAAKHVSLSGRGLLRELECSHQLDFSLSYLQDVTTEFGKRALGKEEHWTYAPATAPGEAAALVIYLDGTCGAICEEGYKQIMVGAIDVVDAEGERLETVYLAHAPEDGKTTFLARMERELDRLRPRYGDLLWLGLCDGAPDLQAWLEAHCDECTLDFYHVTEYVSECAPAYAQTPEQQKAWLRETLHVLKHHRDGAKKLLRQLTRKLEEHPAQTPESAHRQALVDAVRYVSNNIERMDYAGNRKLDLPIGSGVIEAACKHVVKQRVGCSGMRWKRKALQAVLTLRSLYQSTGRWEQFWNKVQTLGW